MLESDWQRLTWLCEEIIARVQDEKDPRKIGDIEALVSEFADLQQRLNLRCPPMKIVSKQEGDKRVCDLWIFDPVAKKVRRTWLWTFDSSKRQLIRLHVADSKTEIVTCLGRWIRWISGRVGGEVKLLTLEDIAEHVQQKQGWLRARRAELGDPDDPGKGRKRHRWREDNPRVQKFFAQYRPMKCPPCGEQEG